MSPLSPDFAATLQILAISGNRRIDETKNHVSARLGERVLFVVSLFNAVAYQRFVCF